MGIGASFCQCAGGRFVLPKYRTSAINTLLAGAARETLTARR